MHHLLVILIVMLPLLGVLMFWLLPFGVAIPAYIAVLAVSGLMYWGLVVLMRRQARFGREGMIGASAVVVSKLGPRSGAKYVVRVRGELWNADSSDDLKPGQQVTITAVVGLTLTVVRLDRQAE